jgi:hypothetical protein
MLDREVGLPWHDEHGAVGCLEVEVTRLLRKAEPEGACGADRDGDDGSADYQALAAVTVRTDVVPPRCVISIEQEAVEALIDRVAHPPEERGQGVGHR